MQSTRSESMRELICHRTSERNCCPGICVLQKMLWEYKQKIERHGNDLIKWSHLRLSDSLLRSSVLDLVLCCDIRPGMGKQGSHGTCSSVVIHWYIRQWVWRWRRVQYWYHLHTHHTFNTRTHTPCSSCQPCDWLPLVLTAELLYLSSPVVERPPHPHKNCSLDAHFPPQPEDLPLHSVPWLLCRSPLIYCPFSPVYL